MKFDARTLCKPSPVLAVLLGMVSVQGGAALAKSMFPALGALGTVSLRITLSAVMLLAVFRPALRNFSAAQWQAVLPYGIVLAVMNYSFYEAIGRIPLGLAVTLEFTGPLAVAVIGSRRAQDFCWVLAAGVGIALIAPWGRSRNVNPSGVLLALCAGACWAAYIVIGGRVSRVFAGGTGVATGMLLAGAAIAPFAVASHSLTHLTPTLVLTGLVVALLSSALPYSLEMVGLRALPARTFGILMSIEPAIGALSGLIFLQERLTPSQWLAVVLVITASAGSTITSQKLEMSPET